MTVAGSIAEFLALKVTENALVPTMGALHEGHLSLVRAAKDAGLPVVVSIFVNPMQFGPNEDYSRYPRNLDHDVALLHQAGADFVFAPTVQDIYPRTGSKIMVPEVAERFEGSRRPGHFDGVATIVCKLFQITRPQMAIFGLKDLQQCAVIQRMVEDLNIRVELSFQPTLREPDGLAMSSRNVYLSPDQRRTAPALFHELSRTKNLIESGKNVENTLADARASLVSQGFELDYYDLIDRRTFSESRELSPHSAVITAVKLGTTRLIDNILIF
ncbi:MAG TPA: pantoate--beta-alanine ligase [Fimbriimonas sp.]|nr:pantoate--beta-alanine ligase [Fimbriimonas sp.]